MANIFITNSKGVELKIPHFLANDFKPGVLDRLQRIALDPRFSGPLSFPKPGTVSFKWAGQPTTLNEDTPKAPEKAPEEGWRFVDTSTEDDAPLSMDFLDASVYPKTLEDMAWDAANRAHELSEQPTQEEDQLKNLDQQEYTQQPTHISIIRALAMAAKSVGAEPYSFVMAQLR